MHGDHRVRGQRRENRDELKQMGRMSVKKDTEGACSEERDNFLVWDLPSFSSGVTGGLTQCSAVAEVENPSRKAKTPKRYRWDSA